MLEATAELARRDMNGTMPAGRAAADGYTKAEEREDGGLLECIGMRRGGGEASPGARVRRREARTWPSWAAVWTSFSTVSRREKFLLSRMQSMRPQQHCSADEFGARRARTELDRGMGPGVGVGEEKAMACGACSIVGSRGWQGVGLHGPEEDPPVEVEEEVEEEVEVVRMRRTRSAERGARGLAEEAERGSGRAGAPKACCRGMEQRRLQSAGR